MSNNGDSTLEKTHLKETAVTGLIIGLLCIGILGVAGIIARDWFVYGQAFDIRSKLLFFIVLACLAYSVRFFFRPPSATSLNIVLVVAALIWAFLFIEGTFRLYVGLHGPSPYFRQAMNQLLNLNRPSWARWAPKPYVMYVGSSAAGHNSMGFHDTERRFDAEPGIVRIACLGGSTTYGTYNYPPKLQKLLDEKYPNRYEVLNFGMCGWTTAETLINYALLVKEFKPAIILIHHSINEVWPRLYRLMEPDYSHFRNIYSKDMLAKPPPDFGLLQTSRVYLYVRSRFFPLWANIDTRSLLIKQDDPKNPFIVPGKETRKQDSYLNPRVDIFARNLNSLIDLVQGDNATPVLITQPYCNKSFQGLPKELREVAVRSANAETRRVAAKRKLLLIDLDKQLTGRDQLFGDFVHMSSEGRLIKAELILKGLEGANLLNPGK